MRIYEGRGDDVLTVCEPSSTPSLKKTDKKIPGENNNRQIKEKRGVSFAFRSCFVRSVCLVSAKNIPTKIKKYEVPSSIVDLASGSLLEAESHDGHSEWHKQERASRVVRVNESVVGPLSHCLDTRYKPRSP